MSLRPGPASRPAGVALFLLALLLQLSCGEGDIITLGQGDPRPRFFDEGRPIGPINSESDDDNPTLTDDMLEIFFTSNRPDPNGGDGDGDAGGRDVYCAKRSSRTEPFDEPEKVMAASSEDDETSSVISPDGLTLWVGTDRGLIDGIGDDDDDYDIWFTTRATRESAWGTLRPLSGDINSPLYDDIPRPLGLNGTIMPIASKRYSADDEYETLLARRVTVDGEFLEPEPIPEISAEGRSSVDAFMTDDGLLLFFNRADGDEGELLMSWRRSPEDDFSEPLPLDAIGGDQYRDPWVNKDGTRFVFSSNRGDGEGELDIYMAFIELPSSRELAGR